MKVINSARQSALDLYYLDPRSCKECEKIIKVRVDEQPASTRRRSFCNSSCSAKYNNKNRTRLPKKKKCTKSIQLGIPFGTARNRLQRNILFNFIEQSGQNECLRCGKPMSSKDYSIEHKIAWQGNDTALFWSLDNISFSHISCNSAASRHPDRVEVPEGSYRCCVCKNILEVDQFPPRKKRKDITKDKRRSIPCTSCHSDRVTEWRTGKKDA